METHNETNSTAPNSKQEHWKKMPIFCFWQLTDIDKATMHVKNTVMFGNVKSMWPFCNWLNKNPFWIIYNNYTNRSIQNSEKWLNVFWKQIFNFCLSTIWLHYGIDSFSPYKFTIHQYDNFHYPTIPNHSYPGEKKEKNHKKLLFKHTYTEIYLWNQHMSIS